MALFMGIFSGAIFASQLPNKHLIKNTKDFAVELNTRTPEKNQLFSLKDYDISAPTICQQSNVFCHEKLRIVSRIEKEWEVNYIPQIWDPELTAQDFANFYPNLPEDKIISDGSRPQDKWILQRILYERGLLDIFPTGKIGYLTEKAIIKLQHYKDIEEYDHNLGIAYIGPATARELNLLKERMKRSDFVSRSPLPPISINSLSNNHKLRLSTINTLLKTRKNPGDVNQVLPLIDIKNSNLKGNMLNLFGEIGVNVVE